MRIAWLLAASALMIACGESSGTDASTGGTGSGTGGGSSGGSGGTSTSGGSGGGSSGGPTTPHECQSPGADWVFCSDFEEGDKSVWDDYDGNPDETNLLMSAGGPFNLADNHVMRLRVPPGRGGADLVKVLPSEHDELYARWYVQWEPGFDFTAANHGGGLHAGDRNWLGHSDTRPNGDDWFTAWLDYRTDDPHILNIYAYYRGMYQDCVDPNGQCWGDNFPCTVDDGSTFCEKPQHRETVLPPTLETGKWYCVELMASGGSATSSEAGANGRFDFWVDGKEIGPWTDLWLRTDPSLKLSILWLNLFHHAEHSVEGLMLDNVVVSKSRVGCP
jgi:hypothetical protein